MAGPRFRHPTPSPPGVDPFPGRAVAVPAARRAVAVAPAPSRLRSRGLLVATLAIAAALVAVAPLAAPAGAAQVDPIFPQAGTRSYDVQHYAIGLDYAPRANRLRPGTGATIRARAKRRLRRIALDFRGLAVTAVEVDGRAATFERRRGRRLGEAPGVSRPGKLIVRPRRAIRRGARFSVAVSYQGRPRALIGPDQAPQGWIRACNDAGCDGSFTVNEPLGAQSWFPCNDRPGDKATVSTTITVPGGFAAIGTGELLGVTPEPGGRQAWRWEEQEPTATYLTSATVGRFLLDGSTTSAGRNGPLPVLVAIDAAAGAGPIAQVRSAAAGIPAMLRFLSARLGPYPFGSTGLVADWVPAVGYALENQTRPHFSGEGDGPYVSRALLAHELAHQWMGNSVTPRRWSALWFSEGWATYIERLWAAADGAGIGPGKLLRRVLRSPRRQWRIAPADPDRDPARLFDTFAVYERPAAMLEGYRRIAGTRALWGLARRLGRERRHAGITEKAFVREALRAAGARGERRRRLRRYFHQWLHWRRRPALTPADFRRR